MSAPRSFYAEDFHAEWVRNGEVIEIYMWGNAETTTESAVLQCLKEVREETEQRRPSEVRVDVRALEFMDSSCLKYFVNWIAPLQERAPDCCRITLVWNQDVSWQKRTAHVLASLAPDVLTAVVGRGPLRPRPNT